MTAGRWFDKNEIQKMIDSALLPTIPVIGGVVNVRTAANEFMTIFDILIGKSFGGKLPDDIDAITVTGPEGVCDRYTVDYQADSRTGYQLFITG